MANFHEPEPGQSDSKEEFLTAGGAWDCGDVDTLADDLKQSIAESNDRTVTAEAITGKPKYVRQHGKLVSVYD